MNLINTQLDIIISLIEENIRKYENEYEQTLELERYKDYKFESYRIQDKINDLYIILNQLKYEG